MENNLRRTALKCETIYTSICANRLENNICCFGDYLLFSSCNCLVIYNLKHKQEVTLLFGHSSKVNGQQLISDIDEESQNSLEKESYYIISTSYDKSAIIWHVFREQPTLSYKILLELKSPKDVYITRCSIKKSSRFMSITTSIDGDIYLWNNDQLLQTIQAKYYCFHSKIHTIKVDGLYLIFVILAGSDNILHVFQLNDNELEHLCDLTGHNDWIKSVDTLNLVERQHEFLIASASQDSFVRVWHMKIIHHEVDSSHIRTLVSRPLTTTAQGKSFKLTATLETVLSGHEGIVHSLCWFKKQEKTVLKLFTCSEDKTIVLWRSSVSPLKVEEASNNKYEQCAASVEVWKEIQRLGETGETNLPFLGVCLSNDESILYSSSLRGAIHSWKLQNDIWVSNESITGHFEPVTDISWENSGAYLLSSSLDKTCRLHAIAKTDNQWRELARPQVHGHEINCLTTLNFGRFATGSEEKTIRVYETTQFFLKSFKKLAVENLPTTVESNIDEYSNNAQLPALSLSIKAAQCPYDIGDVSNDKNQNSSSNDWYSISKLVEELAKKDHLEVPPIEEILLNSTLWWEINKLFGHGNELHSLASNSDASYLASASRANRTDLANIIIWECTKFRKAATIEHHSLTVTRLKFSPNDKYLLSVSRDRTWCLSERTSQPKPAFKKLLATTKTNSMHDRIIWDCCWTHDSKYFMTVARDKKAILWSLDTLTSSSMNAENTMKHAILKQFECSITAVDSPGLHIESDSYTFALGFEDGSVSINLVSEVKWETLLTLPKLHQLTVRRLTFKPNSLSLASGGDDSTLRIVELIQS